MKFYIKFIIYSVSIFILCSTTTVHATPASLFMSKSVASITEGESITLGVKVKSTDQSVNAVSGTIVFPSDKLQVTSVSKENSILNFWTQDPIIQRNKISFEGIILNPGYRGDKGNIINITFEAKKSGFITVSFSDGAILANDGLGTNILDGLNSISFNIVGVGALDLIARPIARVDTETNLLDTKKRFVALPVITDYTSKINSKDSTSIKGKGEPNTITQIVFSNLSKRSLGEKLLDIIQSKKRSLDDIFVNNDEKGIFEYTTPNNLVAGVYNATPFLVDKETNTARPGFGVQLSVDYSNSTNKLIILINLLILLIIFAILIIMIFIPWYLSKQVSLLKRKILIEKQKIEITRHQISKQYKIK